MALTFFTELKSSPLHALVSDHEVLAPLASRGAAVSMAMLDLDEQRLRAAERICSMGIDLTAWLVLDPDAGYWLNADNFEAARARYEEVRHWIWRSGLPIQTIGLDIEPPIEDAIQLLQRGYQGFWELLQRRRTVAAYQSARERYLELVGAIRADGFCVETYQVPIILDERVTRTSLLQRALGFVDVPADREVLMLYRSLVPSPLAECLVDAYGREAQAIAVGITGGGVDFILNAFGARVLALRHLLADLRRAARYTDRLYVFSLEGCVQRRYLREVCQAELAPAERDLALALGAWALRRTSQTLLRGATLYGHLRRWKRADWGPQARG